MLSVRSVDLNLLDIDSIKISWEIAPTTEDVMRYSFYILRGESAGGPFETVAGPLVDRYNAVDSIAPRKMAWRNLFYVVRVVNRNTNEELRTEAKNLSADRPLEATEMVRLNNLMLREFTGRPCIVFPVRTFGQRCSCFDITTSRRSVSSCQTCFNTGFVSGFHYPMVTYMTINPYDKGKGVSEMMITATGGTNAIMSVDPLVKIGDIIIEKEGTRWRVQSVRATERMRSPVHQEVALFKISEGDIEFKIPFVWPQEFKTAPRLFAPKMDIGD